MAVKIRLSRRGRKKLAIYDVVVADARAPRDGRFIEKLGTYNPNTNPADINISDERAFYWAMKGAQPTDTVKAMLSYKGIMLKKHLQRGVDKGAITQEAADKKFQEWLDSKSQKIQSKIDSLTKQKDADAKARFEAETKIKEARAEALRKAAIVEEAPTEEEPTAEATTEVAAEEVVAEPIAVAEEPQAEATPAEEEVKTPEATPEASTDATEEVK